MNKKLFTAFYAFAISLLFSYTAFLGFDRGTNDTAAAALVASMISVYVIWLQREEKGVN